MTLNRRRFLAAGATSLAAMGFPIRGLARPETPVGFVYGVSTLNPLKKSEELSSVVRLNLSNGELTYHPLPDHRFGHSLLSLPDGGFFAVPYGDDTTGCVFLDAELNVIDVFEAPAGFGFGGHAALLPGGDKIFGHFNRAGYGERRRGVEQTGQNFVLDVTSRKIVFQDDTDIVLGHDIILTRDGKKIIVGDDSTLEHRTPDEMQAAADSPFSLINHAPALVVFDASTYQHERTLPLGENGSFVHIEEDHDGAVFGAVEQFVSRSPEGLSALRNLLGEEGGVERYVDNLSDKIPAQRLPYPGPLMRTDLTTGEFEKHLSPLNQAPFDIKMNARSGRVFGVFTDSNMLARYNPLKGTWGYFGTDSYGIEQPFGLTDIPGTNYMIVNGFKKGMVMFDVMTMNMIGQYPTDNFGVKHLTYRPA